MFLIYTRPYKAFSRLYPIVPWLPSFSNQATSYPPHGSLWLIESPFVPFFTLTLDFIFVLPLLKKKYNVIISVTYKFSKRVTLIKGVDTWSAEQWADTFFNKLDLIDWGVPGELIINWDLKIFSKFWTALFAKLGVKLIYSIAYHPQTGGSNKHTNQTIEITLRFYFHAIENAPRWPEVLPRIQSLLNNTSSSTTGKTPNKIIYRFSSRRLLDLCSTITLPNTYVACIRVTNTISFILANHKEYYNRSHHPLFMKIGDWAMLKLHKSYSILFFVGVTNKQTQPYVSPFQIVKKVGQLAYKFKVPSNWKIYPVFSIA